MNSENKICQNCHNEFTIESEDFKFYERFNIPVADECPSCRWKHLLAFWTFGKFRKTKSDLSGKEIFTILPASVQFPLYSRVEWASDAWDPTQYARDYDFSRSFFEQFKELQFAVPHPHQTGVRNINCQWSDDVWNSKNCYLCRSLLDCENLSYGYRTFGCRNSVDLTYCFDTEYSYDCTHCFKCYKVRHSFDARNSIESMFLYDCRNVQNCFMCWNLRNKKYYILNQRYSREEYFEKLKSFDTNSYQGIQKLKEEFKDVVSDEAIHRAIFNTKTVNSSGNFITESRNCFSCYFLDQSEDCRYIFRGINCKDSIDSVGTMSEKSALSSASDRLYETVATLWSSDSRYSAYLDACEECEYCFGCVGLRKKQFCIFNKQYSKEEYNIKIAEIKDAMRKNGEWGKFFPYALAYSGYNSSLAHIYFPETKDTAKNLGTRWDEEDEAVSDEMSGDNLPDRIDDVKGDISKQAVICSKTGRRFNIAPHELIFYKEFGIPLPHHHPDWRTLERFKPLTILRPYEGACIFCSKNTIHYYPPEFGYKKIACESCYLKEVV
uniref:Uncharacterized protein n=1 Tax=Candidatus Giovannonibacteria bacterium GW2011_GWF2_42_19 TaxID=1618659 RepID=A0A0G1CAT7_9BACT|nr:MAG: hypothetical protein UV11_C0025G0015 [Candidatus Giovannonibacteria bacterium GW2011_GWF2_42_19]